MKRAARAAPGLLRRAWLRFFRDRCLDRSAVVAFYSLVSLGPLLYLVGAFLARFFPETADPASLNRLLSTFLPPEAAAALDEVGVDAGLKGSLVLVALPGLLWAASTVFTKLEQAINAAFKKGGGYVRSRLKAFAVLGLAGFTLAASIVAQALLSWLDAFRAARGLPEPASGATAWLSWGVLVLFSYAAFLLTFKYLPHGKVRWNAAFVGAAVAVPLWEGARHLFAAVLGRLPGFGLLDGAVAALVAFLLWADVAVAITLFGAQAAAVRNETLAEREAAPTP